MMFWSYRGVYTHHPAMRTVSPSHRRLRKDKEKLSRHRKVKSSRTTGAVSSRDGGSRGYDIGVGKGSAKNYYEGLIDEDDY